MDDQVVQLPERTPVALRVARAAKVIGMPVTQAQCAAVFARLRLPFTSQARASSTVTPPSCRFDLQIEEDLIEEVVRVIGYDKLPDTPPLAPVTARARPKPRRGCMRCAARWRRWATRRPSTSASSRSAGSASWPATPTRSGC